MCSYNALGGRRCVVGTVEDCFVRKRSVSLLVVSRFSVSRVGNVPFLEGCYGVGGIVVPCVPGRSEVLFICSRGGLVECTRLVVSARGCFNPAARIVDVGSVRRRGRGSGPSRGAGVPRRGDRCDGSRGDLVDKSRVGLPPLSKASSS